MQNKKDLLLRVSEPIANAPEDSEIVTKLGFAIDASGSREYPVLSVQIIANESGLKYLANVFAATARRSRLLRDCASHHIHLGRGDWPFQARISDDLELRVEVLTRTNKKRTYRDFGVSRKTRRSGNMIPHLNRLIAEAESSLRRDARHKESQFQFDGSGHAITPLKERVGRQDTRRHNKKR